MMAYVMAWALVLLAGWMVATWAVNTIRQWRYELSVMRVLESE